MKKRQCACEPMERRVLLSAAERVINLPSASATQVFETSGFVFAIELDGQGGKKLTSTSKSTGITTELASSYYSSDVARDAFVYNDKLYFYSSSNTGIVLYEAGGDFGSLRSVLLRSGNYGLLDSWQFGNQFYSLVSGPTNERYRLIESDATPEGTSVIWQTPTADTAPRLVSGDSFGRLWFTYGNSLWSADATNPIPHQITSGLDIASAVVTEVVATESRVYFTTKALRPSQGEYTQRLFTCGTDGSGLLELSIPNASTFTYPPSIGSIQLSGDHLLFLCRAQVWSIQGVETANALFGSVEYPSSQMSPLFPTSSGRVVFYHNKNSVNDPSEGFYTTDGTVAGTIQIFQQPLNDVRFVSYVTGSHTYVIADPVFEEQRGWNVVRTDGTPSGTRQIRYLAQDAPSARFAGVSEGRPLIISVNANQNGAGVWKINPQAGAGSFEGTVFTDWTRDGLYQSFEPTHYGTVYLDGSNNGVYEGGREFGQPNSNGSFKFSNLSEGVYTVRFKPSYPSIPPVHTPAGDSWQVNIGPDGEVTNVNFTAAPAFTFVWGKAFNDLNADGIQNLGEVPLSSQTFYHDLNGDGVFTSGEPESVSDSGGYFYFQNVAPGEVRVGRRDKLNWIQIAPALRGLRQGLLQTDGSVDIGLFAVHAQAAGAVSGVVWNDNNANGSLDGDDTPLSSASVFADINADGARQASEPLVFSNNGFFLFSALASEATSFRLLRSSSYPVGTLVTPEAGFTFVVPTGGSRSDLSFLLHRPGLAQPPGRVSGTAFNDRNADGARQQDEPPLANLLVYIDSNANGNFDATERHDSTDESGQFAFPNSAVGSYRIRVLLPSGYSYSPTAPADVFISSTVPSHNVDVGLLVPDMVTPTVIRFGYLSTSHVAWFELSETMTGTATISDFVLYDAHGGVVDNVLAGVNYNAADRHVSIVMNGAAPQLARGLFTLHYAGSTLTDVAGNALAAFDFEFGAMVADVDGDGTVGFLDLLIIAQNFGQVGHTFSQGNVDYSANGAVDFDDLLVLAQSYGTTQAAAPILLAPNRHAKKTTDRTLRLDL